MPNSQYYIRKTHRFLGVFTGVQFLLWTLGGLYFSWTDINEVHGDEFKKEKKEQIISLPIRLLAGIDSTDSIQSLELRHILGIPYWWLNENTLINAQTGVKKDSITQSESIDIAQEQLKGDLKVRKVTYLVETGKHHEFRGRDLPVWQIEYETPSQLTAYVSIADGSLQRIRHQSWRWFDFLWMLHTMDYEGRDDFNNWLLRGFSLIGIITISSGFALFFVSRKRNGK